MNQLFFVFTLFLWFSYFDCHTDYSLTEHEVNRRPQKRQGIEEKVKLSYLFEWPIMVYTHCHELLKKVTEGFYIYKYLLYFFPNK